MTDDERAAASALVDDSRTNDQLAYDLFMDVLRAGALANAADVFGARQPGVRIVTVDGATGVRDAFGRMLATGHLEDGGDALPGAVVDRNRCTVGSRSITVDNFGNPLDVGREQRLYTSTQRIALAVRDGGCMFPECRVPASYCEAHHCDHWQEDHGRTDIDRGILLCRHHHMLLHNNGWKIAREGLEAFLLHPPGGGRGDGGGGRAGTAGRALRRSRYRSRADERSVGRGILPTRRDGAARPSHLLPRGWPSPQGWPSRMTDLSVFVVRFLSQFLSFLLVSVDVFRVARSSHSAGLGCKGSTDFDSLHCRDVR